MSDKTNKILHTISLLVSNKPGVLVRIALVFARRGYNIDSLVVSPSGNSKYSRMTITAQGNLEILDQIIKQADKLIDVIHASEHKEENALHRELMLIKVKCTPTSKKIISKFIKKFQSRIIDEKDKTLILEIVGTSSELDSSEALLKKYGIIEMIRSGKLVIAKGKEHT